MKLAHTVNYAPGLSGMYNSVRDLVLEERRVGAEAEVIDDVNSPFQHGIDGIFPVTTAYGDKADIICWHHAIAEAWLNEPHRNLVLFLHGTPEFNFFTEMHEEDKVFSLLVGAANSKIPKAFVTMWKRHVPYWESFLNTKVHYIPAWANMSEWKVSTLTPDPKVLRIAMVDYWRITREPFGIIAALEQIRKNTNKKLEINVWGITQWPNNLYKAIIQWAVETDTMILRGNTRKPMEDIYHKNDLVVSMSTEETRVVREAYACGVPVVCARGPLHFTDYSTDGIDAEALAVMINKCHDDLVKGNKKFRHKLRTYAETNFDVRKSVRSLMPIFEGIVDTYGSTNKPKFKGAVRPVSSVAETCDKLKHRLMDKKQTCFLRFGDGDLILMNGQESESLHDNSPELQKELIEAFTHNEEGYIVSSVAGQINEGRMQKGLFAAPEYSDQLLEIVNQFRPDETLDNANALAYMSVFEPDWFIDFLRSCVHGKKVLFIGGESLGHSGLLKQVFNIKTFFPVPMKNSYYALRDKVDEIKELTKTHDMIICAAGMATRVLAKRLWTQGFRTDFIDIGSVADAIAGLSSRSWMGMITKDYIDNYSKAFMPSKTDIVVLSYGQEDKTIKCFEYIAKNTENYRVVWVDNGSSRESIEAVKPTASKLLECDFISVPKNEGFSKGVNRALRKIIAESDAPYILLLNNDVVVSPGWLTGLVSAQVSSGFDAIGPLTSAGNPHSLDSFREVVPTLPKFDESVNVDTRADILRSLYGSQAIQAGDMISFFCCLLCRELVEQTGFLDEGLFAYGEDNDYFERMRRSNRKFGISLGTYVHHDHGVTSDTMGEGWKEATRKKSVAYLLKKWGSVSSIRNKPEMPSTKVNTEVLADTRSLEEAKSGGFAIPRNKPESRIVGFYHAAAMRGEWLDIVDKHFKKMMFSGLYQATDKIYVSLVGDGPLDVSVFPEKCVVSRYSDFSLFERPTINKIHEVAVSEAGNFLVWYAHTKGVSRLTGPTAAWRAYMQYFQINRWQEITKLLRDGACQTCGVDWLDLPFPHYSGNFFWATAEHIRRLSPLSMQGVDDNARKSAERWIGSVAHDNKNLWSSKKDLYVQEIIPADYVGRPLP